MSNNQLNRKQKIELLQGIANGKVPVSIFQSRHYKIRVGYSEQGGAEFFMNDKPVSQEEFSNSLKVEPGAQNGSMPFKVSYGLKKDSNL